MKCVICSKLFGTPDSKGKTCGNPVCVKAYQKAYHKAYQKTDKYKAYQKTDKYKAYQKAYQKTDKYKACQKAYWKTDKYKAYQKAYMKARRAENWTPPKGSMHDEYRLSSARREAEMHKFVMQYPKKKRGM